MFFTFYIRDFFINPRCHSEYLQLKVKIRVKNKSIKLGLDIGSISAKCILSLSHPLAQANLEDLSPVFKFERQDDIIVALPPVPVHGDPIATSEKILEKIARHFEHTDILLAVTGSQSKRIAERLSVPYINEFKAVSLGVSEWVPGAQTIMEIGGNISRYLRISRDPVSHKVSIHDYERNGDCAAGTGSFLDQQAWRLHYSVEEIGVLVQQSDHAAHIAGRCSVFAKSDMIHAQQRFM